MCVGEQHFREHPGQHPRGISPSVDTCPLVPGVLQGSCAYCPHASLTLHATAQANGWVPLPSPLIVSSKGPLKRLNHASYLTNNADIFYVWRKKNDQIPLHTSHVVLKDMRGESGAESLNSAQLHSLANTSTTVDTSTTSTLHKSEVCRRMTLVSQETVREDRSNQRKQLEARKKSGTKEPRLRNQRKFYPTDQSDGLHIEEHPDMFREEQLSSNIMVEVIARLGRATPTMVCVFTVCIQRVHENKHRTYHRPRLSSSTPSRAPTLPGWQVPTQTDIGRASHSLTHSASYGLCLRRRRQRPPGVGATPHLPVSTNRKTDVMHVYR